MPFQDGINVPEGLETISLSEAFAQAVTEGSEATPPVAETAQPAVGAEGNDLAENAPVEASEQPAADEGVTFDADAIELANQLMSTEMAQDGSDPGIPTLVPGSDEFLAALVEVKTPEGLTTVSVNELRDGYLRQADYTRKTQALAEQRKRTERAEDFFQAFSEDPAGFSRTLAVQAGLIAEGAEPITPIDAARIPTVEELNEQVEAMVAERIDNDPRVQSAQLREAQAQLNEEFDRLQTKFRIPLAPELRKDITDEALRTQNADLEGILAKRLLAHQQRQSAAGNQRAATTARPGVPPASATVPEGDGTDKPPADIREAWRQAKVIAAQQ